MIDISSFGSSSSGNCSLIRFGKQCLLVDCGIAITKVANGFETMGLPFSNIEAVLITHTHSDHINYIALKHFLKNKIPVLCPNGVYDSLMMKIEGNDKIENKEFVTKIDISGFTTSSFQINPFSVLHDSDGGCYGYEINTINQTDSKKVTIATDLGEFTDYTVERFTNSDYIIIESNHDIEMLHNSGRPLELIERIKTAGHLSNLQCASFLKEVLAKSAKLPERVFLAHLSQQCNTPEKALLTASSVLKEIRVSAFSK